MNSQRTVIYTRRRHALMGERIGLDVLNTLYDTALAITDQCENDFESFKMEIFKTFAMESPLTLDEFKELKHNQLTDKLFEEALKTFKRRMEISVTSTQASLRKLQEWHIMTLAFPTSKTVFMVRCLHLL